MAKITDMKFVYNPTSFPNFKKLALILQKFGLGHIPTKAMKDSYSNEETLIFSDKESGCYNEAVPSNLILTSDENIQNCKLTINPKRKIEINYDGFEVFINRELKERFPPFLDHSGAAYRGFRMQCHGVCNINKETDEIKNVNASLANIKFMEEATRDILPLMRGIGSFSILEGRIEISVNQFGKLKSKRHIFENVQPADDKTVNTFIDSLIFMKDHNVKNVTCGAINITCEGLSIHNQIIQYKHRAYHHVKAQPNQKFKSIEIKLGGIPILREHSFEKFKYMFHPGIHLLSHFLKSDGQLDNLSYMIQKQKFRSV